MTTKFLNLVIAVCLIGIGVILVRDTFFSNDNTARKVNAFKEKPLPTVTPSISPIPGIPCDTTALGNINFSTLTYQVRTRNNFALNPLMSSGEASLKNATLKTENITLNLLGKSFDSYVYSVGTNSKDIVFSCSPNGVTAKLFGNSFNILSNSSPQQGDTWKSKSTLDIPLGLGDNASTLEFTHKVTDVRQKRIYNDHRTVTTVEVYLDSVKTIEYKTLSGVGIENFKIDLQLDQLGSYYKEFTLQNAR